MKVLHLNFTDSGGGAAIAMMRLHYQLIKNGIDSSVLVMSKQQTDSSNIICVTDMYNSFDKVRRYFAKIRHRFTKQKYHSYIYSVLERLDFDVLHIHWIYDDYGDMLSLSELEHFHKPIVISLHDCVSFTGGCHYYYCGGKYTECRGCQIERYKKEAEDVFKTKRKVYSNLNITFVAPSSWMFKMALNSELLHNCHIIQIPWGIDISVFYPQNKQKMRRMLGWDTSDIVLLSGAVNASDPLKGIQDLEIMYGKLQTAFPERHIRLLCFGKRKETIGNIECVGFVQNDDMLSMLYNAADVMLVPSRQESFGLTTEEALACGTPVVVYDRTGMTDMVCHQRNGYIARSCDVDDFSDGVLYCIEHNETLSKFARNSIVNNFAIQNITIQFVNLYKEIMMHNDKFTSYFHSNSGF